MLTILTFWINEKIIDHIPHRTIALLLTKFKICYILCNRQCVQGTLNSKQYSHNMNNTNTFIINLFKRYYRPLLVWYLKFNKILWKIFLLLFLSNDPARLRTEVLEILGFFLIQHARLTHINLPLESFYLSVKTALKSVG